MFEKLIYEITFVNVNFENFPNIIWSLRKSFDFI